MCCFGLLLLLWVGCFVLICFILFNALMVGWLGWLGWLD